MQNRDDPEINLGQVLERIQGVFGRFRLGGGGSMPYFLLGGIILALIIWAVTGFYTVQPGQVAVLKMFGKYNSEQGPGLNWFFPGPIGSKTIVNVDEIRRLELGFRGESSVPVESLMITGDENIVDVRLLVQFDIKDPVNFLFQAVDPAGITMRDVAETSLRQVVGSRAIDDVLTDKKEDVQAETKDLIQNLLDNYKAGINIREVKLQGVNPPSQVQDAFDDVVRAKEDKEKIINLADAYEESVLPTARGEAAKLIEIAEADKTERINLATGQAERFKAILSEYLKAPDITRQRLYLDAMEDILPNVTKYIVDPGTNVVVVTDGAGTNVLPVTTNTE
tara:strand:- start:7989 stop:8999 length:1011 start_codon:yes stop_codon:yes gene_type:complete